MTKLHLLVEVRDFDLDRIGASVSVLESATGRKQSESYMQMTLPEFDIYVRTLKLGKGEIELTAPDAAPLRRSVAPPRVDVPNGHSEAPRAGDADALPPRAPVRPAAPGRQ